MKESSLNGISFHSVETDELVKILDSNIKGQRKPKHIAITNTESMYFANKYSDHKKYLLEAAISLCDGVAITLAGKIFNTKIKRYHGPDFILDVIRLGQEKAWKHYFLGSTKVVNDDLINYFKKTFQKVKIVGSYCPPFRDLTRNEENEMISDINQSRPDFLWVGLGLPKQEKWIAYYKNKLDVPWNIGVGAAFDFHAGFKHRPPKLIQTSGLEWLFRMIKEPRMIPRNIRSLYQFLFIILSNIFVKRSSK
ncbi:WecB/TagA/CpsF family glycosyltransferase [Candidatus Neomarinimicrobiota bacterium]